MAIPAFFGTMLAEGVALKKRAERNGPSPVDYEPKDTFASLAMGTGSLILPIYLRKFTKEFRPIGGKYGKALAAVGATAFVATTVADRVGGNNLRLEHHQGPRKRHWVHDRRRRVLGLCVLLESPLRS